MTRIPQDCEASFSAELIQSVRKLIGMEQQIEYLSWQLNNLDQKIEATKNEQQAEGSLQQLKARF